MRSIFTSKEISTILREYPNHGPEYCANLLKKPLRQIKCKIGKLRKSHGLKLSQILYKKRLGHHKGFEKTEGFSVNPDQFIYPKTKEAAYILGLLWADGYVYAHGYQNRVSIEMVEEDLKKLLPIFQSTGKWHVSYRNRLNRKPQMVISTNNRPFVKFLLEHKYVSKSNETANYVLSKIPDDLKHYWFRGLIDGDGCFYINSKNSNYQLSISSSYEQDWSYVEKLFNKLNVRYSISRLKKKYKSSSIRVTNRKDIIKIGEYIYNGFDKDQTGLIRKYDKYKLIHGDLI